MKQIQEIDKKFIDFDPQNPRKEFDKEELETLQESIESHGQQEPVHLEELGKNSYMVSEGNKRVAAIKKSKRVGFVMAIVEKKLSPVDRLLKQIIIDSHRNNWSMSDRDVAWKRFWDMGKYNADSFAKKISVSKRTAENFIDRMGLGQEFLGKMKNISVSNIDETKKIKDVKLRKKILSYADKNELKRKDVRKLALASDKVSEEVIDSLVKDKISVDDVNNFVGLNHKEQIMALTTTKALNTHKKKLKNMIKKGDIDEQPFVIEATNKITEFQKQFFKLSADLRTMGYNLDELSKKDTKKLINTQMGKILKSCLNELENKVLPAIKKIKETLGDM